MYDLSEQIFSENTKKSGAYAKKCFSTDWGMLKRIEG
jgi:hypothetical protein